MFKNEKKLLICEEALIDYSGHFHSWINAIKRINEDSGLEVFIAGNVSIRKDLASKLKVIPAFNVNSWDNNRICKWPKWRRAFEVLIHNWRTFYETKRVLKKIGKVDMVLFTAVRQNHILGIKILTLWGLGRYFNKLSSYLLTSHAIYNSDFTKYTFSKKTLLFAYILKSFKNLVNKGKVNFLFDSQITLDEYKKLTGLKMKLMPSPISDNQFKEIKLINKKNTTFSFLGCASWEKGIDTFQDAIILILKENIKNINFVIQWNKELFSPKSGKISLKEELINHKNVRIIKKTLNEKEYQKELLMADFMVLPYRKFVYKSRLSGVAIESAVNGIPIIATDNTWLSWCIDEFASGIKIQENNPINLAEKIIFGNKNKKFFKDEAMMRSSIAKSYNSKERYLSLLWND